MKKFVLLLIIIFGYSISYSQTDCSQGDGTFRYGAKLFITNVPSDFDKDDFINHIIGLDNITNQDLATLNQHVTLVYKTFPSQNPHTSITIVSTIEIYSILDSLENSIEFHYCVINDCEWTDGTFNYHALLTSAVVPNDFDKEDFINFITGLDNISNEDLATLETHITSVYKSFPGITGYLKRLVSITATLEIYPILAELNNSIEHHSCNPEAFLGINENQKNERSIVYPNPITEDSILQIKFDSTNIKIELINSLGQIIYTQRISGKANLPLKNLPKVSGISFLKISDLVNGGVEILKIVSE